MPVPEREPPSPDSQPSKRARQSSADHASPASLGSAGGAASPTGELVHDGPPSHGAPAGSAAAGGRIGQSSSFRNVSACNRCRLRKNRCDQRLPSCASCDKAGVACVGYDPITKREIPRSYIFYLEKRVEQLEELLATNSIAFPPAQDLDYSSKSAANGGAIGLRSPAEGPQSAQYWDAADAASGSGRGETGGDGANSGAGAGGGINNNGSSSGTSSRLQRIASKPGPAAGSGSPHGRYLGSTTGISFARVVFAAVQSSVSDQKSHSDKAVGWPYRATPGGHSASNGGVALPTAAGTNAGSGTSMRDSFFGLHTKPTIHPATFPDRPLGLKLTSLYFEHANPQIPVLHKGEFMEIFDGAYADEIRGRGPRELYVLNMVFAIGAGILVGDSKGEPPSANVPPGSRQCQPEEYHASAIVHFEACLGSSGGLEDLQMVLLLANFALLRPVPPGLWYIIGVAVRLAVDLGLYYEDGKDQDSTGPAMAQQTEAMARERGRREYVRDLRRRLWWCTYSLDRLVSLCVGRPFGISDQVVTTEFPSLLEDRFITPNGIVQPPSELALPSYKLVAQHYFRLRLLQSEVIQVLQFRQAQGAWANGKGRQNPYMHSDLPSPFLSKFDSFRSWRIDIDRRLYEWKNSAPRREDTGVAFSVDFLSLNYWQAIIMLYRQSLSVPTVFEGEYDTTKEVNSPAVYNAELREDEDRVYLKVAEAGQKILRLYRQLHLKGLVNHTYLTTHHLFVAGISYLYAIWHSPIVRSRLTMDEVDFTILAATSVFNDFMDKCPPAEACRDAFDRTVKATLRMVNASGGFGQQYPSAHASAATSAVNSPDINRTDWSTRGDNVSILKTPQRTRHRRQSPSIDQPPIGVSDPYSTTPSLVTAFQKGAQYRLPGGSTIKAEPETFPHVRNLPIPALRSNTAGSSDNNIINDTTTAPDATSAIDQAQLITSPSALQQGPPPQVLPPPQLESASSQLGSPLAEMTTTAAASGGFLTPRRQLQQQQQFSPGPMAFSDLQGIDFLQGIDSTDNASVGSGGGPGPISATSAIPVGGGGIDSTGSVGSDGISAMEGVDFSGASGGVDTHMDFGFGLGWEGVYHDFGGGGQQVDLFDGFFFGGGGGGNGGGSGGGGASGSGNGNGSG